MDESKGLSQPLATLPIKRRDTNIRSVPHSSKRATNTRIAPEKPLVIDGVDNHELDSPGIGLVRTAPDIMDTRTEEATRFPLTERPLSWKLSRVRTLDIPLTENSANFLLITSKELHIDVLMISCLYSEKEIECPSASDPPGNR
jgi:hypothetical protein